MSLLEGKTRVSTAAVVSLATTTDNILNTIIGPIKIYRFGVHAVGAKTTGTAGVVTLQSLAADTASTIGTVTTPDTIAAGATVYKDFNPPLDVAAGARFKAVVTTAAAGGTLTGYPFVEYTQEPLTKSYLDGLALLT